LTAQDVLAKTFGLAKHRPLPEGMMLAALAKREEELYLPDQEDPLRLPLDSPALLLVQYLRNEAHRFAVTFHRLRRAKRFLGQPDAKSAAR
jgi:excinuclease UvrABC nuclease subunit